MTAPAPPRPFQDVDPIDSRLARAGAADVRRRPRSLAPLFTSPHTRGLVLVPLGFALGPAGLNFLSIDTLSFLDPIVSVSLAMLGILLGFALVTGGTGTAALLPAVAVESALTIGLVAGGVIVLGAAWPASEPGRITVALLLGACAAASVSPSMGSIERADRRIARAGDLDSLIAIAGGAALLIALRYESAASLALVSIAVTAVSIALATAGWLLVGRTDSEREQHAFVAGTLLLLAGAAAYLRQSALLFGVVAGVVWAWADGTAQDRMTRDIRYVQHPLMVLLLLVAGARLVPGVEAFALAFVFLLCRTTAKFAGTWLVARRGMRRSLAAPHLLSPGTAGIAVAIATVQAAGDVIPATTLLSAVVVGTLATDLFAWSVRPREEPS